MPIAVDLTHTVGVSNKVCKFELVLLLLNTEVKTSSHGCRLQHIHIFSNFSNTRNNILHLLFTHMIM